MTAVPDKRLRVAELEQQLAAAREDLRSAESLRETNPVEYLARMIYANEMKNPGGYGYAYGNFGEHEMTRAAEVLDIVNGDVDVAAVVITKLHVT